MSSSKIRRTALVVAAVALGTPAAAQAAVPDGDGPWADAVVSANQGLTKGGLPVPVPRSDSSSALGVAERTDVEGTYFSLGFGGQVVLAFDNPICNAGGDDLDIEIVETTLEPYPDEIADVYVSEDGSDWVKLDSSAVKDETLPLPASVPVAHYVKVVDVSDPDATYPRQPGREFMANADGYDVDGVSALQPADCVDDEPPVTNITLTPGAPNGSNGWYVTDVNVQVSATDDVGVDETRCVLDGAPSYAQYSDLPAGCPFLGAGALVTSDGTHQVHASSIDTSGNTDSPISQAFKIDKTKPIVTYSGNAGTYYVDQNVNITCSAMDPSPGSGLASTTCSNIAGPAYQFGLGTKSYSATGTDNAGNVGTGSTSFKVLVTPGSLCRLTKQLVQSSPAYQALPAKHRAVYDLKLSLLCGYIECISPKLTTKQKAAFVLLYNLGVKTLVGPGWLTSAQAHTLSTLAGGI